MLGLGWVRGHPVIVVALLGHSSYKVFTIINVILLAYFFSFICYHNLIKKSLYYVLEIP